VEGFIFDGGSMRTKSKFYLAAVLVTLSVVVLILFVSKIVLQTHNNAKRAAVKSAAASLCTSVYSFLNRPGNKVSAPPHLINNIGSRIDRWYVLDNNEYDQVVEKLSQFYHIDAPRSWRSTGTLLDSWRHRFVVAIRIGSDQAYEVIVVSLGPDGVINTGDDIIRPSLAELPEEVIKQVLSSTSPRTASPR